MNLPTDMKTLNLQCLTAHLEYTPPTEEAGDEIFESTNILIVPVSAPNDTDINLIKSCLDKPELIIENSVNKKRLVSGHSYFIVGEHTGVLRTEQRLGLPLNLAEVQAVLGAGKHIARRFAHDDYRIVMTSADLEGLVCYKDFRQVWTETVAAVVNCDIESVCYWSTKGANAAALCNLVGNDFVTFDGGEVPMSQFTEACVKRRMEYLFNEVFQFCVSDRNAFYHASAVPQGLQIKKYADVRAFIQYHEGMERRRLRDLEIEEGLHNV